MADVFDTLPAEAPPGLLESGNVDLNRRPRVRNVDGSISTVRSISINEDGKEILIPTVATDGSTVLSNQQAVDQYRQTGEHLGKFASVEAATAYAKQLHADQAAALSTTDVFDQITSKPTGDVFDQVAQPERKKPDALDLFIYHIQDNTNRALQGMFRGLGQTGVPEAWRFDDIADHLEDYRKTKLHAGQNVTPEDLQSTTGKVTGAAASVSDIAAGPALMVAKTAGQSYGDAYQNALAAGQTPDEAHDSAAKEVAKMAPVLAAYAVGGKVAGKAAEAILPETAGPIARFLVGGGTAASANLAVSGTTRKIEGQPFTGDLQQNLTDIFFGAAGGLSAAGEARAKTETPIGLEDVKVETGAPVAAPDVFDQVAPEPAAPPRQTIRMSDRQGNVREVNYVQDPNGSWSTSDDIRDLPLYENMGEDAMARTLENVRSTDETQIAAESPQIPEAQAETKIDISPRSRPTKMDIAEQQAREQMQADLRTAGSDQGHELFDAIQQAGGLPSKTSEARSPWTGELDRLEQNAKPTQRRSLFKVDAPDVDELATRLRDHGFDVKSPDDIFKLVENRLRTGKEVYGIPEREAATFSRQPHGWETAPTEVQGLDKVKREAHAAHREIASNWRDSTNPDAIRDVAALGQAVAQTRAHSSKTAGGPPPRLLPVEWPVSRLKPPEISKAEALARVTGNKIVWFRNIRGAEEINGASIGHPKHAGKFFINIESKDPFHTLAGHEITHRMEADAPDLYREYEGAILALAKKRGLFDLRTRFAGYSEANLNRELVANFTEESLRDPARFAEALGSSPTLYQRVRRFITELMEKIQTALGRNAGRAPQAREAIVDLKKADAAMQRAFEIYRTHRITEESGQNFEVAFSRDIPTRKDFEGAANDKDKMREHIATVQRMTDVSPDVKQRVESWYTPTTLKEVNDSANARIDKIGIGKAQDEFMNARKADADTLALGHHVAIRLDQLGRYDEAAMVREGMAEKLTSPAQAMWFISTIAKTSPEGLIRQAQKVVTDEISKDPQKVALLEQIDRLKGELAQIKDEKLRNITTEIVIRNLAKINKPGHRLTPAQIDNLVTKHRAGQLTEEELAKALAKYYKIPQLTPQNIAKIREAQRLWNDATDPVMKLRRGAEMMDAVYGLVPRSFWDKVRATATISMILHGRLPVRIAASNLLQMSGQTVVDAINAVTLDPLMSILTGNRTVTGPQLKARLSGLAAPVDSFRSGWHDAQARKLGTFKSFQEGVRTMLDMATMTTRGIQDVNEMSGRTMHTFSSRFGKLAEDTVTLVHNVVPYAFWNAGYKASLFRQMRAARVDVPTAEMIVNARLDANKAIFQNETAVYHMMRGIRRILDYPTAKITGGKYGIGTATVPFAKVPGAILTEGLHWTPVGFIRGGWEAFRPIFTKEGFRQKDFVDAFTKATLGTGAMVATGYWLAKLGIMSAAPEENKNVEAMRRSTGFGQFRVNVSELKRRFLSLNFHTPMREPFGENGDLTISYNWIEPFAFPLAMGADIAHSQDKREIDLKKGKITSNAIVTALTAGAETLTTHPMLQNLQNLQQTAADQGWGTAAAGMLANVPGNFVPSLVRQTTQYIDNTTRETRGGSLIDRDAARLLVQLPGLSQKYPARYDVFGDAVQRYNYGANTLLNVFFNPAQPDRIRKNANVNELVNLWNAGGDVRMIPGQVQRSITINGKQAVLDNEQLATYQRYVGRLSSAGIARLLASPQLAGEPLEIKQAAIVQVLDAVHEAARIDLFGQQQYSVGRQGRVRIASPYAFEQIGIGRATGLNRPALAQFPY